jgi:hypothetical protein
LPRTFTVRKAGYLPFTIVQGAAALDPRVLAELSPEPPLLAPVPVPSANARISAAVQPVKKPRPAPSAAPGSDIFMQR